MTETTEPTAATAPITPRLHPYDPDGMCESRRRMHTAFFADWREWHAQRGIVWYPFRAYETVHRDGSSMTWLVKQSRFADIADLERRRWAVRAEYLHVAALRWTVFQRIESDHACYLGYSPSDAEIDMKPAFFVYRVDEYGGERHFVEGCWESSRSCVPTEERQPLVALRLVAMFAKLARRGFWLGMLGEVLDRAIVAKLPEQKRDGDVKHARVEINGRSYWYWWNRTLWVKQSWPEDEPIELVFGAGGGV